MSCVPTCRAAGAAPARSALVAGLVITLAVLGLGQAEAAPTLPEIRTSSVNPVPRCATPERLMSFLKRRNGRLDPRFRDIASHYKRHGDAWHVRWDYAFFQMAIETNFLTYRAPSGRMGDVDPKQNNFAGIGTTGGGVPGDSFPDVSTGVLGQIQHLVVYSGEMIPSPVAPRTQLKQEHILAKSRELKRPVRFSDLARRWAADPKYASSIAWVANQFRDEECKGKEAPKEREVLPWQKPERDRRAAADATDDGSPVRTIWRRDDKKQAKAKQAAPKPEEAPAAVAAVEVAPPPPATEPQRETVPAMAASGAEAEPAPPSDEVRFALFTPPAALAEAASSMAQRPAERDDNVPPASADAAPAPASDEATPRTAPSETQVVMGPPAPPPGAAVEAPPAASETQEMRAKPSFLPPSGLGVKPGRCVVETATFGGDTTVLVKAPAGADVHYIALSVLEGFEDSMTKSFLAARADGGEALGTFKTKDAALERARTLCPDG